VKNEPIRLAHVVGSLNYGGAENQVIKLLNGFDTARFEKHLITFSKTGSALERALSPEIRRYDLALPGIRSVLAVFQLARYFRAKKIQVVQAHMYHTNLYVSIAAKLAGVPVIITTEHGMNPWKRRHHHFIERVVISPLASVRVAVSRDTMSIRISQDGVPASKITVIQNCVDVPPITSRSRRSHGLVVGSVGRMVDAKDYSTLLRAFKLNCDIREDCRLVLVGDGPELDKLQQLARDLDIKSRVEFPGWQSDIGSWLDKIDVFVLSSIREGLPVALLEAMAKGLPVVATSVGGIPEVLSDGEDGILVQPGTPDRLAEAIASLLDNENLRARLGKNAREKVVRSFSVKQICTRYEVLYRKLLGQS
jgi:glycosyltransferase involved in cell wall biosynthesis